MLGLLMLINRPFFIAAECIMILMQGSGSDRCLHQKKLNF